RPREPAGGARCRAGCRTGGRAGGRAGRKRRNRMIPTAATISTVVGRIAPNLPAAGFSDADADAQAAADAAAKHAAAPPLAAEAITVRYGRRTAVDGVSLTLPEGTVYALLGRNGAGKSSLVRCLLGQQRATAGRAMLFGRDAWRHRTALMA